MMLNMNFEILEFKPVNKGSLLGLVNISVPDIGFSIRDISIFEKEGKKWASMPARMYEQDGKKKYFKYILFENSEKDTEFQIKLLEKLNSFLSGEQPELPF